ncbi:MAG: AraC family transcriptional regulator, partial [Alphaproteobacteria bacterium]|nr:AraC family transcriptional regulator [Alphaproteobacteria bacterium]
MREDRRRAYGDDLAGRFWLKRQQSHVTRTFRRGILAVTQLKSDLPTPAPTQSIGHDDAYLVGLQLRDVPDHELWQDARPLRVEAFAAMDTSFYDLRRDPIAFVRGSYHSLQFYLPCSVLTEIAQQNDYKFHGELGCRYGVSMNDHVIGRLGAALLPALERSQAI